MRHLLSLFTLGLCLMLSATLVAADAGDTAAGGDSKDDSKKAKASSYTAEGEFIWSHNNHKDSIKAVFTKTDVKDKYDVKFYFKWGKKDHIYAGTAEGQLKDGKLKGTVKADDQNRSFGFEGNCKGAAFSGNHHEKKGKKEQATGTITWKPAAKKSNP